jgi:hypothetical protein
MSARGGTVQAAPIEGSRTKDVVVQKHDHKKGGFAGFAAD